MNGLCVKLVEFIALLEVDTYFHIYTSTLCKNCNYFISRVGRLQRPRATHCKHMRIVIRVRRVKCDKNFKSPSCSCGGSLHVLKAFYECT